MYDKESYGDTLYVNHFVDKKLTFRVIDDGYILPFAPESDGGVFDREGNYREGSVVSALGSSASSYVKAGDGLKAVAEARNLNLSAIEHKHETAVHIGLLSGIWGHFITDSMSFMWFLNSKEYRENFSECPITYHPGGFKLEGNYKRMLEILGINTSLLTPVTSPSKYSRIVLPEESWFNLPGKNLNFTNEYIETINIVRKFAEAHLRPTEARKVFYSYRLASRGRTTGEDKLEKYFASKGYKVVFPEKLSLDEQLNILINCDSFASTAGSCSHNSLFLRDNTEVILIPRANYLTGHQPTINQVHPQSIYYIDSSFSIFVGQLQWFGPFLYFISSNLRKFFNDPDTESIVYPSDFWKYLRSALGLRFSKNFGIIGKADNPGVYKYYSTVAAEYFGKLFRKSWPYRLRQWLKKLLKRKK